jgi:hypothetical protein
MKTKRNNYLSIGDSCSIAKTVLIAVILTGFCLIALQAEVNKKELQAAERKLENLLREAEELQEKGRKEAALERRKKAETLKKRLKDFYVSQEKQRAGESIKRKKAEKNEIRKRTERGRGNSKEAQIAREQLEVMRMAIHALEEAGRRDAAEIMERAIRAREVSLEGRKDRKAAEIREQSPSRATQAELLGLASKLWAEFGHKDKSEIVAKLARTYGSKVRQNREGELKELRNEKREREEIRERKRKEDEDREAQHRENPKKGGNRKHSEVHERKIVHERDGVREIEHIREWEEDGKKIVEKRVELKQMQGQGRNREIGKHLGHRLEMMERRLEALLIMMESLQEDLRQLREQAVNELR